MIVTETGTGIVDANSYESTEGADAYHADRGNTAFANDNPLPSRERALIIATDYIDANFRAKGARLTPNQALQWPVCGATAVPRAVRMATALLASYALLGPLTAPKERGIKSTKKTLGKVAVETVYDDAEEAGDPYPEITGLLADVASKRGTGGATVVFGKLIR